MKKVIVRKTHTGMPPQFYARIDVGGKERMTVLCAVAEAEAHRDPCLLYTSPSPRDS